MSTPADASLAVSALDLLGIDDVADPYPAYRRMLQAGPTVSPDGQFAVLPTYAECFTALTEPAASVQRERATLYQQLIAPSLAPQELAEQERTRPFLFLDPPDHTRLRRLVSRAFTRRSVEALRPWVRERTDAMIDAIAERGSTELVDDLAYPLPVAVISELLGVPAADRERFAGWSAVLARSLDSTLSVPAADEAARQRAAAEQFRAYFSDLFDARRREPRADLVSALVAAEAEGDRLTPDELLATCMLLLIAGHETTVSLIGNGMLALLHHPEHQQRLAADPDLVEPFVEEVLRHDPPVQMTMRVATAPTQVAGQQVAAGGVMVLAIAAANRDPAQFPDPDRFDPTRGESRHLSFSSGIHFCLGAPLARLEAQIVLGQLARRLVRPRLAPQGCTYRENIVLRGLATLPLEFDDVRPG